MTTCAITGSGNIGTDLMYKLLRSNKLDHRALVDIDPGSDGVSRAVDTSSDGLERILGNSDEIDLVFDHVWRPDADCDSRSSVADCGSALRRDRFDSRLEFRTAGNSGEHR